LVYIHGSDVNVQIAEKIAMNSTPGEVVSALSVAKPETNNMIGQRIARSVPSVEKQGMSHTSGRAVNATNVEKFVKNITIGKKIVRSVLNVAKPERINTTGQRIVKDVPNVVLQEKTNIIGQRIVKDVPNVDIFEKTGTSGKDVFVWFAIAIETRSMSILTEDVANAKKSTHCKVIELLKRILIR
jgi:hypothetical protein